MKFLITFCLSVFAIYLLSAPHTVTLEDSGIFLTTIHYLGLSHPPGYPLYTMMAKLFSLIPLGSVAFRVHMFSAACGAISAGFVFLILQQLTRDKWSAMFGAGAYAFSFTVWSQSIVAEVYALNALFFFALFWLILKQREETTLRRWQWIAFVYGLSLTNHWPLMGLATPALILLAWPLLPDLWRKYRKAALLLPLGLLPYLYLVIRSRFDMEIVFLGPIESFSEFIGYIMRSYYKNVDRQKSATAWSNFQFFLLFVKNLPMEILPFMFLTGIYGIYQSFLNWPRTLYGAVLISFLSSPVVLLFFLHLEFNELNFNVYSVYHMIPLGCLGIFAGCGLHKMVSIVGKRWPKMVLAVPSVVIVMILLTASFNFLRNDMRDDELAYDYARLTLDFLPENATLFVRGDTDVGPIAYAHLVEGVRPDIHLLNQSGHFFREKIFDPVSTPVRRRKRITLDYIEDKGRVFSTRKFDYLQGLTSTSLQLRFNGLFYEVSTTGLSFSETPEITDAVERFLTKYGDPHFDGQWRYHRHTLLAQMCNYLVLQNREHPVFQEHPACMRIRARHLERLGKHDLADPLYKRVMDSADMMPLFEKQSLYYHYLTNHAKLIARYPASNEERVELYRELAAKVHPMIDDYPFCDNSIIGGLLAMKFQVNIDLDVSALRRRFYKKCKNFREYFDRLSK